MLGWWENTLGAVITKIQLIVAIAVFYDGMVCKVNFSNALKLFNSIAAFLRELIEHLPSTNFPASPRNGFGEITLSHFSQQFFST